LLIWFIISIFAKILFSNGKKNNSMFRYSYS
jgi:hypothetical protein